MRKTNIGGQGVLEGVMMRSENTCGLAVRKASGELKYSKESVKMASSKNKFLKLPVIRGVVNLVDMMGFGVKTLTKSAKMFDEQSSEYEPSKFEKLIAKKTGKDAMDIAMVFAVIIAIAMAIGIFFILPSFLAGLIYDIEINQIVYNLIEGGIRLVIFLGYVIAISFVKDIKRVYKYHGAEHKTISCFEHEEELIVENVQKYKTLHPRCGTSYLFLVMFISIILFSLLGHTSNLFIKIGLRLLMLPLVAGISYEFLKFAAKGENLFFRIIRWPGLQLQRLTTAEPDDGMVETAILAFEIALGKRSDEEIKELAESFNRSQKKETAAQETAQPSVEQPQTAPY